MFVFYLRRTLRSLRRTPGLTSVMIINMALGLAIWIIAYTAVDSQQRLPIRHAEHMFHVDWGTAPEFDFSGIELYQQAQVVAPHLLLSHADAEALAAHPAVAHSCRTFSSRLTVATPRARITTAVRFSTRQLFSMFELPFHYGGPWDEAADIGQRGALVLDDASNRRLFGGDNSVGRSLDIDGRPFVVAGVLSAVPARVRAYDFSFSQGPALFIPYQFANQLGARPDYLAPRSRHGPAVADLFASDDAFVQLWVELDSAAHRAQYLDFMRKRAGLAGGKAADRRPRLQSIAEFMAQSVPIASAFLLFRACALVALLACVVNLSRLLIVKYQARAHELAVQRALGATRRSVFGQHMLEAVVVALAAIALALPIAALSLLGINGIVPDRPAEFALDMRGIAMAFSVGLGAGLLAGIHPAVRMVRSVPAAFLRLQ